MAKKRSNGWRNLLLALSVSCTALPAGAAHLCRVMPRDDIILSGQSIQVQGEHGDLVMMPNGNLSWNGKPYTLTASQRTQAQNYQKQLRDNLQWIDEGARVRVTQIRQKLDKIIHQQMGDSSSMSERLTQLEAQLKTQMNRIIEHRNDGLTFHYQAIDQVRADGQQLINQAMGGLLQDSINEVGTKALLQGNSHSLQGALGGFGTLQTAIQDEWRNQEADLRQFGQGVCNRIARLEESRAALVSSLR